MKIMHDLSVILDKFNKLLRTIANNSTAAIFALLVLIIGAGVIVFYLLLKYEDRPHDRKEDTVCLNEDQIKATKEKIDKVKEKYEQEWQKRSEGIRQDKQIDEFEKGEKSHRLENSIDRKEIKARREIKRDMLCKAFDGEPQRDTEYPYKYNNKRYFPAPKEHPVFEVDCENNMSVYKFVIDEKEDLDSVTWALAFRAMTKKRPAVVIYSHEDFEHEYGNMIEAASKAAGVDFFVAQECK